MLHALLAGQLTWNIPLFLLFICMTFIYVMVVRKNRPINWIKLQLFLIGIWLLFIAIGSPLLPISYLSFSFHMMQMSFLFFIIPPLILLGIPHTCFKKVKSNSSSKHNILFHLSPKIALLAFAVLFLMYHLPFLLSVISQYPIVQKGYIFILFMLSFRMWWPIAAPDPTRRFKDEERRKFVLASSLYIMPACLLFIISGLLGNMSNPFLGQIVSHLCIPTNSSVQILPYPFHTQYDQILAGAIMLGIHKIGISVTCKLESKCK